MCLGFFISKLTVFEEHEKEPEREELNVKHPCGYYINKILLHPWLRTFQFDKRTTNKHISAAK